MLAVDIYLIGYIATFLMALSGMCCNDVFKLRPNESTGLIPFLSWIGLSLFFALIWPFFFIFAGTIMFLMIKEGCFREYKKED